MRLKPAILIITLVGIVALFFIVKNDRRNKYQIPEKLTLSLIKDKSFLKTVRSGSTSEKEIILTETSKIIVKEIHTVTDNKHKDFAFTKISI
jgi:hypothetical protein